jgi:hypothetical protein
MVGKGGSVGQGVGVEVAVTVGLGMVGAGVNDGTGVAVTVAVGVVEGAIADVADGVIKDTVVVAAKAACVTVSLLFLASGSDTAQPIRFSNSSKPIIDQRLMTGRFICLCSIRFTSDIKGFVRSTRWPY